MTDAKPIFTAVPISTDYLPDGPPIVSDLDLTHSKVLEARIERNKRFDWVKYVIHGIWIPLAICSGILYLNTLIYYFFNIQLIKGLI